MRPCSIFYLLFILFSTQNSHAQTLGGSSIFSFLKLPQHPITASLGGRNVSTFSGEAGLITENPALMTSDNNGQVSTNFSFLSPGMNALTATGIYEYKKINTNLGLTIGHVQYGNTDQTDASGNILGVFNPFDQYIQLTVSRRYASRWNYGTAVKFINSGYGAFRSSALAVDFGLNYFNKEKKIQFGFSAKNMGIQLKTYSGLGEDLPFDMVIGLSKQLEKSPLRFSITAQKIHQFDLLYSDTTFNSVYLGEIKENRFLRKVLSHFILGTELLIGDKLVFMGGYNFLRSMELRIPSLTNGFTGIGYGLNLKLLKFDFYFSRSHYQTSVAQNQMGITYKFEKKKN